MKHYSFLILSFLVTFPAFGKAFKVAPAFPTADGEMTLTFDLT